MTTGTLPVELSKAVWVLTPVPATGSGVTSRSTWVATVRARLHSGVPGASVMAQHVVHDGEGASWSQASPVAGNGVHA